MSVIEQMYILFQKIKFLVVLLGKENNTEFCIISPSFDIL